MLLDSDNIETLKWLIMLKIAGMQKLKHHMDGLKLLDMPIDLAMT